MPATATPSPRRASSAATPAASTAPPTRSWSRPANVGRPAGRHRLGGACAEPYQIPESYPRGRYLLLFAPLDGAPNMDVNAPVGTIFSVLRCPDGVEEPTAEHFLQPGTSAGRGGLRHVRAGRDDGADARRRRARFHARPFDRRLHALASGDDDPAEDARVRRKRLERALLGKAGPTLRGRVHRGRGGAARRRFFAALDRLDGGRGAPHPHPRRAVHVPARQQGRQARTAAPTCSTRPTRWR